MDSTTLPSLSAQSLPPHLEDWRSWIDDLLAQTPTTDATRAGLAQQIKSHTDGEDCEHEPHLVLFTQSNGATVFQQQCSQCWKKMSSFLPHKSLTDVQMREAPRRIEWEESWPIIKAIRLEMLSRLTPFKPSEDPGADWWAEYDAYLQTAEWQTRRRKVLERARGRCEGCGDRSATIVHHLTYKRRGHEMLFDLAAVCEECHRALHPDKEL